MKLATQNLYECLCAALRRPLSQGASALISSLKDQNAEDIASALGRMTNDEATLLFNWLENDRAVGMLSYLSTEMTDYILHHTPPGRLADLDLSSIMPVAEDAESDQ